MFKCDGCKTSIYVPGMMYDGVRLMAKNDARRFENLAMAQSGIKTRKALRKEIRKERRIAREQ